MNSRGYCTTVHEYGLIIFILITLPQFLAYPTAIFVLTDYGAIFLDAALRSILNGNKNSYFSSSTISKISFSRQLLPRDTRHQNEYFTRHAIPKASLKHLPHHSGPRCQRVHELQQRVQMSMSRTCLHSMHIRVNYVESSALSGAFSRRNLTSSGSSCKSNRTVLLGESSTLFATTT